MESIKVKRERGVSAAGSLRQADHRLLTLLREKGHSPRLESTMVRLGAAAEDGALWLAIGSTLATLDTKRRRKWIVAGMSGPLGIAVNYPLKHAFRRRRPLPDSERLGWAPNELSFPSAHATSSFAAATVMVDVAPRGGMLALGLALLVGVGRPYLGMHHPSDVLGGAVCGTILGWFVLFMLKTRFVKRLVS
jgi:membrane-associated phospholipid phosphatase